MQRQRHMPNVDCDMGVLGRVEQLGCSSSHRCFYELFIVDWCCQSPRAAPGAIVLSVSLLHRGGACSGRPLHSARVRLVQNVYREAGLIVATTTGWG